VTARAGRGYRLGPVEQIPLGEGRAFAIDGDQVAVFRTRARELWAIDAVCPHAGGPLADGQIDRRRMLCPLHGHAFALADGSCATGDYAVRTYAVWEEDGQIVVVSHADG
jgi:nitrite reductase [NAD(P)H] small subunit